MSFDWLMYFVAFVCFLIAVPPSAIKMNLVALGLACLTATLLF